MSACLRRPAAKETLEHPCQVLRRNPATTVRDLQLDMFCPGPLDNLYRPGEGELERVGHQVENDLLPLVTIHVDRLGRRVPPRRAISSDWRSRVSSAPRARVSSSGASNRVRGVRNSWLMLLKKRV